MADMLSYKSMYDELKWVGMEMDISYLEILGICLEGLNKTMTTFSQDRWYPG
jgi:hypothetical protein